MKKSVRDVDVAGKRVLVRCDFNVPIKDGVITDDSRIVKSLPTIRYLLEQGARVVLCSHRGRPKGEVNPKYSLAPVAARLSELLGQPVPMVSDCVGEVAHKAVEALKPGQACLLENVRFHPEEEKNDPAFAKELASLGEIFVNDAFGTAHRAHASTAGVANYLPAVCGFLIEQELTAMGGILEAPQHPFVAMLGVMGAETVLGFFPLAVLPAALAGALMAFLLWNFYPARLLPGSVGSMFLAGAVGGIPLSIGRADIALALALPFWVEGLAGLLQALWRRVRRRPLFREGSFDAWLCRRGGPVTVFYVFCALALAGTLAALRTAQL